MCKSEKNIIDIFIVVIYKFQNNYYHVSFVSLHSQKVDLFYFKNRRCMTS